MDNPFKSPVILSLCTGMRGLERGIERALNALWLERQTVTVAAYSNVEAFICYNLIEQMQQGVLAPAPVWTDLKTFPAPFFHNRVHGIIGGYPCQPFSVAGNLGGENDPRHLWPYIKNPIIPGVNPVWCFFENVANHLNIGYETVRRDLQSMGYRVEEGIFTAEEVGAPHERKRLFILAVDHARFDFAELREKLADTGLLGQTVGQEQAAGVEQCGETVGHSEIIGRRLSAASQRGCNAQSVGTGETMADTACICEREPANKADTISAGREAWPEFSDGGYETVGHANGEGLQGQLQVEGQQPAVEQSRWPAPQGSYQHPWEEPRTVKPGLGCTVNGYNFRNDLLRMLGNGVVEQTAALAFLTLLQKHANAPRH